MITLFNKDSSFTHLIQQAMDAKGIFYRIEDAPCFHEASLIDENDPVIKLGGRLMNFREALVWVNEQPNYPLD